MKRIFLSIIFLSSTIYLNADEYTFDNVESAEEALDAIEHGANVNGEKGCSQTPLHKLTSYLDVVKVLVEHGAKVNAKDSEGKTPLIEAICNPNGESTQLPVIKYLISKGADVNAVTKDKMTPLLYAVGYKEIATVKLLVSKGAKINVQDDTGASTVYYAVVQPDVVEFLISKGADVNLARTKSYSSDTPLHAAVEGDHLDTVKLLIDAGANLDAKMSRFESVIQTGQTYYSVTPLHIAVIQENLEIVKLLVESGADMKAKDAAKKTPLDYAKGDILKYLKKYK